MWKSNTRKYGNRKVEVDGILFDSVREAKRYTILKAMQDEGTISDLKRQVKFVLIPAQYREITKYGRNGNRLKPKKECIFRECAYIADFVYQDKDGNKVVEDTKGFRTTDYQIKKKLMYFLNGITIQEI